MPVSLAAGIALYFSLPVEPTKLGTGAAGLAVAGFAYRMIRVGPTVTLVMITMALGGFLAAKLQVDISFAPSIASPAGPLHIGGFVEEIVRTSDRTGKIVVRLESASGLEPSQRPKRVKIAAPLENKLRVGDFVEGQVRLFPLLTPIMPNGYDFARSQWLEGVGAHGDTRSGLSIREGRRAPPWLEMKGHIENLRQAMAERIRSALPGELGLLAVALITGERASLSRDMKDSLQASGLAHIVSISGLHMSLVAGGFFWLLRALLALSQTLTLECEIKKWSALAALAAGAIYLVLSGWEVPTQRSYIMVAIMFAAIIAGRPALNLRNVSVAAMLVLLVDPAALLQPGLQMSFLAVTGLLSYFESARGNSWLNNRPQRSWLGFLVKRCGATLYALAVTTVIAGICTAPAAAFHFNRISLYGLIANLLALPVVSAVVMPMALAGTLLMPFGMEQTPFSLMGAGLRAVMAISDWTAGIPGAQITVPYHSSGSSLLMASGLLWISLVIGAARWLGAAICMIGFLLALVTPKADVLVERTAANIAVRNDTGDLVLVNGRRSRFATERWLLAYGDSTPPAEAARRQAFACQNHVCVARVKGKRIAFMEKEAEGKFECPEADVLISAFPLRGACRQTGLRIDRFDVWRNGAHALYIEGQAIKTETARRARGRRPWVIEPKPRGSRGRDNSVALKVNSAE
jgi:competence protein ComEC